jgi:hypothetical protein
MNIEGYSTDKARAVPLEETAVGPALRTKRFHAFVCTAYTDPSLAGKAAALGSSFRQNISVDDEGEKGILYGNFAVGDESTAQLYGEGERYERLKALKKKYDPEGVFNHFIPIV